MKTIFSYLDYRRFLADYYQEKKQSNKYLLWYMGYHLNLDENFLQSILQEKGHLTENSLPQVFSYFMFSEQEARFFKLLYNYNTRGTSIEKERICRELKALSQQSRRFMERIMARVSQLTTLPVFHIEFRTAK